MKYTLNFLITPRKQYSSGETSFLILASRSHFTLTDLINSDSDIFIYEVISYTIFFKLFRRNQYYNIFYFSLNLRIPRGFRAGPNRKRGFLKRQQCNSSVCATHWWPLLTSYNFLSCFLFKIVDVPKFYICEISSP